MTDEAAPPFPGPPRGPALPASAPGHFSVGISYGEVMLTMGASRAVIGQLPDGTIAPQQAVEWYQLLVMSPQTATMLVKGLTDGLSAYAKTFGALPPAPENALKIIDETDKA